MFDAFSIIWVMDLGPGEGARVMVCFRKLISYCGIAFIDQRSARLLAHLQKTSLSNITMMGDSLYDARFASAAAGNAPTSSSSGAAAAKPKARPGGRPLSNLSRAQTLPHTDPFPDEEPTLTRPLCQGANSVRDH